MFLIILDSDGSVLLIAVPDLESVEFQVVRLHFKLHLMHPHSVDDVVWLVIDGHVEENARIQPIFVVLGSPGHIEIEVYWGFGLRVDAYWEGAA